MKKNDENKLENILIIKKKGFLCKLFPVPLTNLSLVRWLVLRITVKEYKKYSLKNGWMWLLGFDNKSRTLHA